jgi:uncharacterized membrane protein
MEKMMAVIFDDQSKAYRGSEILKALDAEGSITIHSQVVIQKNADGSISVYENDNFPIRTAGGTALGSLIGLFGGPVGLGIGAMAGALVGSLNDLYVAGVDADFVDEVAAKLTPGKYAVVADMSEEWETPVDTRMEPVGGTVFRTPKKNFEQEQRARHITELRAEIDRLNAERAQAKAEKEAARLQAKIDKLNAKLQSEVDQAKDRSEQINAETNAKVEALQKKSTNAQAQLKATLEAREQEIRKESAEAQARLKAVASTKSKSAA